MLDRNPIWLLAAASSLIASPALAEEAPTQANPIASAVPALEPDDLLSDDELGELRGGESLVVTNQTMTAITSGNVINGDYVAGDIALSDFALSNFNGLGNVLINSGAQVSLQTGMNVTINVGD